MLILVSVKSVKFVNGIPVMARNIGRRLGKSISINCSKSEVVVMVERTEVAEVLAGRGGVFVGSCIGSRVIL